MERTIRQFGWFREYFPSAVSMPSMAEAERLSAINDEKPLVVSYLAKGWVALQSDHEPKFDVLQHPDRVLGPPSVYTDGVWVWPAGIAYYVDQYNLWPPSEFLDHMRSNRWVVPDLSVDELKAVVDALQSQKRPGT